MRSKRGFCTRSEVLWGGALAALAGGTFVAVGVPVQTTLRDFFAPGTQPNQAEFVPIFGPDECVTCHGNYDIVHEPFRQWAASPMGQAARDPAFWACLAIANQDAQFAGDFCLRCHTPAGWLGGRSNPPDGSALFGADFSGVNCNFCHRMVDPMNHPGAPAEDAAVLAALDDVPQDLHSGSYVVDPQDRRRGPYDLGVFFVHDWLQSGFHQRSEMCATCHDVSNPVYERQPDGTYALGNLNQAHPTTLKTDQFPVERTYSEWLMSDFGQGVVDSGGRFGGSNPLVSSCQDCHMPSDPGQGCFFGEERSDLARHTFNGGNNWLMNAVRLLHPDEETGLSEQTAADSIARAEEMLRAASDLTASVDGPTLNVRITNESGHKLPTGYAEGRRMWINVRFFDATDALIGERGGYDPVTAVLDEVTTKVYEGKQGLSAAVAAATGLPEGEGFHFALNNTWVKDNRIPPRGFTNANFDAIQATPVGATYADGQHWDDTAFDVPAGARSAEVRVFYQSVSKEYVEFLRDANVTNDAGEVFYTVWQQTGMSPPVEMDFASLDIAGGCNAADIAPEFGQLNVNDVIDFVTGFNTANPVADVSPPGGDGLLNVNDVIDFVTAFNAGCP